MSEKFIVTITREFGSMGRPIARRLSELLNVEFYDRDIVEETARQMELPLSVVSKNEESKGGILTFQKRLIILRSFNVIPIIILFLIQILRNY